MAASSPPSAPSLAGALREQRAAWRRLALKEAVWSHIVMSSKTSSTASSMRPVLGSPQSTDVLVVMIRPTIKPYMPSAEAVPCGTRKGGELSRL